MTLIEARVKRGFSQEELSVKSGLSQTQLSFIERGQAMPHMSTRKKIEQALNLKVDWIMTRMESNLTGSGYVNMTDEIEGVINTIAIYIQSGQRNEREERFKKLRSIIYRYEKKLQRDEESQLNKSKKRRRNGK